MIPALDIAGTPARDIAGMPALDIAGTPALDITGLSTSFGGVRAVVDVSFAVPPATVTALIGPNGAGKTTLFNLITHLTPPTQGTVRYFGQSLDGLSPERIAAIGLVRTFQTARVFPGMTVLENVMTGAHRLMRVPGWRQMLWSAAATREERSVRERAETLLDIAGLLKLARRPASDLPMGAQKLLEIMRALMAAPRLLLLDEPAAGLNDTETAELSVILRAIRAGGITTVVVEHNMSLVMGVADQVVVLDAGQVIAMGSPAEIRGNRAVIEAYVGRESP
jgi:branched-chain amino acid transport system ATP-binding protein